MAEAFLASPITPEHFSSDMPLPAWGLRGELEQRVEMALDYGLVDAAEAAIALLDEIDGDADAEALDDREDDQDEILCASYGLNQSEPRGFAAARRRTATVAEQCRRFNEAHGARNLKKH